MKVSLVLNAYIGPAIKGGPGKEGYQLALDLHRKGVLGKVFCYGVTSGSALPSSVPVPFCTSRAKSGALHLLSRATKRYPRLRGRRLTELWMDARYSELLNRDAGDILYCPKPLYPKTLAKAAQLGMKTIVETSVLHPRFNRDVVAKERNRLNLSGAAGYTDPVRVRYMEQALQRADVIFAWSPFLRESYIRYGLAEEKVRMGAGRCEPPGVSLDRFYPAPDLAVDKFMVLHMSSITVIKGVQYLLEAWANIAGEIDGNLVLVGAMDRDMRRVFERYTGPDIKWVGPTNDPVSWYRKASLFVSPSLSDAGPRTVLESMACGVPAIVSDRCGISTSIQSERNGLVYRHDDVNQLAELIMWCYRNRNETRSMGQMALDTVKSFNVANYAKDVWQRINEVA